MQLVHITDDDKLGVAAVVAGIITCRAPAAHIRPSLIDSGCTYGQLRQARYPHQSALYITQSVVEGWYDGQPVAPPVRHVGDDEKIALADASLSRVPDGDYGALIDLGCQLGQRLEAGVPRERAFHEVGAWLVHWYGGEHPWPLRDVQHPDPLVGQLRIGDRCYADDRGPRLPCFLHAGDLIGQALVYGLDRVSGVLDAAAAAGYHGVRSWFNVPTAETWWHDKPAPGWDPRDARERFVEVLAAGAARGLTWHLASGGLKGLSNPDEDELFDLVADAMSQVGPDHFALIEACNEVRDTGDRDDVDPEELKRLVHRVRARHPQVLYALSAYTGTEEREDLHRWTAGWQQFYYVHGYRGGQLHDKVRHIFSLGYDGEHPVVRRLGWQGEPAGPGRRVSAIDNQHELDAEGCAVMAAMAAVARQVWCYMSGPGVILGDSGEQLEAMPGFLEVPRLLRALPQDLMRFGTLGHAGETQRGRRIHVAHEEVRYDYAIADDGRFVEVAYGPTGSYEPRVERSYRGEIFDPGTSSAAPCEGHAGGRSPIAFTRGRVIVGQLTS